MHEYAPSVRCSWYPSLLVDECIQGPCCCRAHLRSGISLGRGGARGRFVEKWPHAILPSVVFQAHAFTYLSFIIIDGIAELSSARFQRGPLQRRFGFLGVVVVWAGHALKRERAGLCSYAAPNTHTCLLSVSSDCQVQTPEVPVVRHFKKVAEWVK